MKRGVKMFKETLKGTSINNIPTKAMKPFGDDVRIVEICENCPYEKCIENTTKLCPRFKQERDKILQGDKKDKTAYKKRRKRAKNS